MSEAAKFSDDKFSHVIVRKRLSLQETASERLPMFVSFTAIACFMLISGAVLPLFVISGQGSWLSLFYWMAATWTFGIMLMAVARYAGNVYGRDLKQIEELEAELSSESASEPVVDLQKLVELHHKHRHYGEAEFYSQRLLHALAEAAQGKLVTTIASADCWLTTPRYKRSITGRFLWLFETRGRLLLTEETLWYWSPKVNLSINLEDVISVERLKYSWWQKPIPMHYICLRFFAEGRQHEVELTAGSQTGTVFDINNAVSALYEKLQTTLAKKRRSARK